MIIDLKTTIGDVLISANDAGLLKSIILGYIENKQKVTLDLHDTVSAAVFWNFSIGALFKHIEKEDFNQYVSFLNASDDDLAMIEICTEHCYNYFKDPEYKKSMDEIAEKLEIYG